MDHSRFHSKGGRRRILVFSEIVDPRGAEREDEVLHILESIDDVAVGHDDALRHEKNRSPRSGRRAVVDLDAADGAQDALDTLSVLLQNLPAEPSPPQARVADE